MSPKSATPCGTSPGDGAAQTSEVRAKRKILRITQAELAHLVGVSRQTIVAVEQGDYAPSVFLALKIGRVLESTVEELFTAADPMTPPSTERERR
ncbi:helix-turn-helix transcriptional regulator [Arthrobacter sp. Br18]|uniref:helix-turn-helix transcriptional regulator n=1 Tax=Arthrobacter sp. Br18 TaxID=1312954 RepID=UPI00056433EA|nr:helix-turn-helix transcriptional regulator [Arthrobacter sp. Br18]